MLIPDTEYTRALSIADNGTLAPSEALTLLAVLVDGASDREDQHGTDRGLALGNELLTPARYSALDCASRAYLHYCLANAWNAKERLSADADKRAWDWHAEPHERQILHLRTALAEGGIDGDIRVRALTNLANALDRVGRVVDAIAVYEQAMALAPKYGMPAANRGVALKAYARCVPDEGHAYFIHFHAVEALGAALALQLDSDQIRQHLTVVLAAARSPLGDWTPPTRTFALGRSKAEREYRAWALGHRLFLNPLNDLGALPIAAHDPLMPRSIVTPIGEGPSHFGFLNAMKQEYATARFMLFQGLHRHGVHYADRNVKLVNTMDYPVHQLATEEIKIAYRLAYSLLDKIAVFVSRYFALGHAEKDVYFRSVWYESRGSRVLHRSFVNRPNLPLRGLFWISKDIFERRDEHRAVLEPDARDLDDVRNHMEHKHLHVVQHMGADGRTASPYQDANARVVTRADLERKALRILKLARASLIHVVNAVAVEERTRAKASGSKLTAPMPLTDWEDDWKC